MSFTPSMPGSRANAAGQPSMGSGNVPFAPGVMSGNLGSGQQAPLARQMSGPTVINIGGQQGPPPEAPQGQSGQPGQQGQQGPAAGMAVPQMAEFYVNFLQAYMQALMTDTSKPMPLGIY